MKQFQIMRIGVVVAVWLGAATLAHGLTFGLVGKSRDDPNFVRAWQGCALEAKKSGDECLHFGGLGAADPRFQKQAIEEALRTHRLDGLAISVTASDVVAQAFQGSKVPVVTFDSSFNAPYAHLSRAYVGTDNLAFGHDLANAAKRLRPQGGTVCLMTAANDLNLAQRVLGVRQGLAANRQLPAGQRLTGEGGWTELARCPWNSADQTDRAMTELAITLKHLKPDVFISVGHWPVVDVAAYRQAVAPYQADLVAKHPVMVVGVGHIAPDYAALLQDKLVHAYVSIDFEEIGRKSYTLMRALASGKPVVPLNFTVNLIRVEK